jgi:rRNA-processing protein FCF1
MNTQQVTIKFFHAGDIRRLCVDLNTLNFETLVEKAKTLFSIEEITSLKYLDEEEEFITFSTDEELKVAAETAMKNKGILHVYLNYERKKGMRMGMKGIREMKGMKLKSDSSSDEEKHCMKRHWMKKLWMKKMTEKHKMCPPGMGMGWNWCERHKMCPPGMGMGMGWKWHEKHKKGHGMGMKWNWCERRDDGFNLVEGDVNSFPEDINHLFLDVNNMMFVNCVLRRIGIRRKDRKKADTTLSKAFQQFHTIMDFSTTTLVFDETVLPVENEGTFRILCARPTFSSAADALLAIASERSDLGSCLFVTSDGELAEKLKEKGAKVMRPRKLLKFACSVLFGEEAKVSDWFRSLLDEEPELKEEKKEQSSEELTTTSDSSSDDEELKHRLMKKHKRLLKKQERIRIKTEKMMEKLQNCTDEKKKERLLKKRKKLAMREARIEEKLKK